MTFRKNTLTTRFGNTNPGESKAPAVPRPETIALLRLFARTYKPFKKISESSVSGDSSKH